MQLTPSVRVAIIVKVPAFDTKISTRFVWPDMPYCDNASWYLLPSSFTIELCSEQTGAAHAGVLNESNPAKTTEYLKINMVPPIPQSGTRQRKLKGQAGPGAVMPIKSVINCSELT
jgi:hypothetical protein